MGAFSVGHILIFLGVIAIMWLGFKPLIDYLVAGRHAITKETKKVYYTRAAILLLIAVAAFIIQRQQWSEHMGYTLDCISIVFFVGAIVSTAGPRRSRSEQAEASLVYLGDAELLSMLNNEQPSRELIPAIEKILRARGVFIGAPSTRSTDTVARIGKFRFSRRTRASAHHPLSRSRRVLRATVMGHEEQVPPRRLRVCYWSDASRSRRVPNVRF